MSLLFLWFWSSFKILTACCHLSLSSSTTCIPAFLFYLFFILTFKSKDFFSEATFDAAAPWWFLGSLRRWTSTCGSCNYPASGFYCNIHHRQCSAESEQLLWVEFRHTNQEAELIQSFTVEYLEQPYLTWSNTSSLSGSRTPEEKCPRVAALVRPF